MQTEAISAPSAEAEILEGLRGRIEAWRHSEPKSHAMPEELWEEASAAAQLLGVFPVSRELRLNYRALKGRALPGESKPHPKPKIRAAACRPQFIELKGLPPLPGPVGGEETVLEVVAADGAKMTVRMKGTQLDLAALVNGFRGRP